MSVSMLFSGYIFGLSIVAVLAARKLYRQVKRYSFVSREYMGELPTVTVCIPARNETHAMTQCLESVLASDYKKLEVIVFDDSSVDDTSVLIKSFARSGVRFIEGQNPPGAWLGKNFALQGLLDEASGQYIVFMDVDVVITPTTISRLMHYTLSEQAAMVSVIPQRLDRWRASVLFGSLRYLWLLIFDSEQTPAASGPLWCVDRKQLQELGGVATFKDVVQPEISIAAAFSREHRFKTVLSNDLLGVTYKKKWTSQAETSIRLLTPLTGGGGRSFAWFLLLLTFVIALIALPLGFYIQNTQLLIAGTLYNASLAVIFCLYSDIMWGRMWWLGGLVLWPLLLVQELLLLAASMIQYARGRVSWKGRLIAK